MRLALLACGPSRYPPDIISSEIVSQSSDQDCQCCAKSFPLPPRSREEQSSQRKFPTAAREGADGGVGGGVCEWGRGPPSRTAWGRDFLLTGTPLLLRFRALKHSFPVMPLDS